MKVILKDYTGKNKKPMYIGNESVIDFELDDVEYRCKLGGEFIVWRKDNSNIHLHLDFHDEIFSEIEKNLSKNTPN